jgi:hypothetical protein
MCGFWYQMMTILLCLVYSRTLSISWVEDEFTKESSRGAPGDMCVGSVEEMTKV